jgi:hypothetical protein
MNVEKSVDQRAKVMKAAREDDLNTMIALVKAAPDSDRPDVMGLGLNHAAAFGGATTIPWLVSNGADVNQNRYSDPSKRSTPLFNASANGHIATVAFLLDSGAAIDKDSFDGETPLMGAASQDGHADVVALLLERGANPNAHDEQGNTALMHVAESSYGTPAFAAVARLLLAGGADPHLRNLAGQSAKEIAVHASALDVSAVIDEHDANVLRQTLERSLRQGNPAPASTRLSDPMDRPAHDMGSLLDSPKPARSVRRRL